MILYKIKKSRLLNYYFYNFNLQYINSHYQIVLTALTTIKILLKKKNIYVKLLIQRTNTVRVYKCTKAL